MAESVGRSESRRRERRLAILQAAISLFARNGFAQTGISDVARAVGLSHGTIFLYFPSKEALFRAAVLEPLEGFAVRSLELMEGEGDPIDRIRRLVEEQMSGIAAERSYLQIVQAAVAQGERFGDLAAQITTIIERVVLGLSRLVAAGIAAGELAPGSPDAIAASYIAYLNGIGLVILAPETAPVWEHLIDQGLRLFSPLTEAGTTKGDRQHD